MRGIDEVERDATNLLAEARDMGASEARTEIAESILVGPRESGGYALSIGRGASLFGSWSDRASACEAAEILKASILGGGWRR